MKKLCLILAWALYVVSSIESSLYPQQAPKITPRLQKHLNEISDTTLVHILIVFKNARTWSPAELRALDQMPRNACQNFVVSEVKI